MAYKKDIDFSEWEIHGDKMLRPLVALMDRTAEHKLVITKSLQGIPSVADKKAQTIDGANDAVSKLQEAQNEVGERLQFTPEGLKQRKREASNTDAVSKLWTDLRSIEASQTDVSKNHDAHQELIGHLRTMIAHAGDTSNLILDPDLDSYYMMDIVLLALPQTIDRLQQIQHNVSEMIASGALTSEQRTQLGVYAAMLQEADADRIAADYQTVMNEDPNFYGPNDEVQNNLTKKHEVYQNAVKPLISAIKTLASEETISMKLTDFHALADVARLESYNFWEYTTTILDQFITTRISSYKSKQTTATITSIAGLIALLIAGWWFARHLSNTLDGIARKLDVGSTSLANTSSEMSDSSVKISDGATQQAAAIQQTAASLEEMTAMITKNTENTQLSTSTSRNSRDAVEEGKTAVGAMIEAMGSIQQSNELVNRQVEESNRKISEMTHVINQIAEKTKVINDIVFQTKLLSFNASVEAARAGEHGKGFTVVAEEVGNLASMSGNAAKEIQEMLDKSISKVNEIINESNRQISSIMALNREKISGGHRTAERCQEVLEKILLTVSEVDSMISEIAVASKEQTQGVNEINRAMNDLDATTQQSAHIANMSAQSAEQLNDQSSGLKMIINDLNQVLRGHTAA